MASSAIPGLLKHSLGYAVVTVPITAGEHRAVPTGAILFAPDPARQDLRNGILELK